VTVIVETEAYDKVVRDGEGGVVGLDRELERVGFEEEGGDADRGGLMFLELVDKVVHRMAGIDNVFYYNDVAVAYVFHEALHLPQVRVALGTGVGLEADKSNVAIVPKPSDKLGSEHKGPVKYANEEGILVFKLLVNLLGHAANFFQQNLFGNEYLKPLVF
jgi:hypothetical protein